MELLVVRWFPAIRGIVLGFVVLVGVEYCSLLTPSMGWTASAPRDSDLDLPLQID